MPFYRSHAAPFIHTHLGRGGWGGGLLKAEEGEDEPSCCISMRLPFACRVEQFIRQFGDVIVTWGRFVCFFLLFFLFVVTSFTLIIVATNWQQVELPPANSNSFLPWSPLAMLPVSPPRSARSIGGDLHLLRNE